MATTTAQTEHSQTFSVAMQCEIQASDLCILATLSLEEF